MSDFDFEPVRGLPEMLPRGEPLLWQGAPSWTVLARQAFHIRKVGVYFALLIVWSFVSAYADHKGAKAWAALPWLAVFGVVATGILTALAYATARSTVYSITSRRLVIRYGLALPLTVNLPFRVIGSVGLRINPDGTGDMPVTLTGDDRIAWLVMWPHVRPWRLSRPEPMLRAVPAAKEVAGLLSKALAAAEAERSAGSEIAVRNANGKTADRVSGKAAVAGAWCPTPLARSSPRSSAPTWGEPRNDERAW